MPTEEDKAEQPPSSRRYRRAVAHARGYAMATALLAIPLGFTADDVGLLQVPGYIVGLAAAFFLLAFGSLLFGYRLHQGLQGVDPDRFDAKLESHKRRGRLFAILASLAFIVWGVFFSTGVPPWAL